MKKIILAIAAATVIAACTKEATPEQKSEQGKLSFSAALEQQGGEAKTAIEDGAKVVWTAGDEVCMYHWDNGTVTYAGFTADNAGVSTTFTDNPEHSGGLETINTGDIVIYPFHEGNTLANTLTDDHTVTFTTSVDQTYVPNSFPAGANVAVGVVTEVAGKPFVNFRNVFGVLKLSLTGDKKIKSIRIADNDGKKLTGDFSVDMTNPSSPVFTQTGGSDYILLSCGEEGVQLNMSTPTDFYIVVPTGAFEHGFTATVTPVETKYQTKNVATTAANIINRSHVRAMPNKSVMFPATGLLDGVFTVDASNTKVRFSSGLLQAKYSAATTSYSFQIAESQLERITTGAGNTTMNNQYDNAIVDLFGFSSDNSASNWGISTSTADDNYSGTFVDWGTHPSLIASYSINFKTVSSSQWYYLLNTRATSLQIGEENVQNKRYAYAKVNGITGILLFPDQFVWLSSAMGVLPTIFNVVPDDAWGSVNNYSLSEFEAMEKEGMVFLISAGEREASTVRAYENRVQFRLRGDNRFFYTNNKTSASCSSPISRHYGLPVRLVSVME